MMNRKRPEDSLPAAPDATSKEDGPTEPQRLLPNPSNPKSEVHVVLNHDPARDDQDPVADVQLQASDTHVGADYKDGHPKIDLDRWYSHACRPYLIKFATGQPSDEVKKITQDVKEHRSRIKNDLLRTGRVLSALEFDESRCIRVQQQRGMGLRERLLTMNFLRRMRRHGTPRVEQSLNDTSSVRSDGSDFSWETTNSNSSQTSESIMNDVEQSCAQFLRTLREIHEMFDSLPKKFRRGDQDLGSLKAVFNKLEDSLKVHQYNARMIGFSDIGLDVSQRHETFRTEVFERLRNIVSEAEEGVTRERIPIFLQRINEYAAAAKMETTNIEYQIDKIMAQGKTVFDEFYNQSLLFMDDVVHSVAQETRYKVNDVVDNNILVKRKFVRDNNN